MERTLRPSRHKPGDPFKNAVKQIVLEMKKQPTKNSNKKVDFVPMLSSFENMDIMKNGEAEHAVRALIKEEPKKAP